MFHTEREAHAHFLAKHEEEASKIKITIEVSHEQQIDIEEYCMKKGLTLSAYFLDLHNQRLLRERKVSYEEMVESGIAMPARGQLKEALEKMNKEEEENEQVVSKKTKTSKK
jgi:Zn ribbon nucleic-acid-binding protein